LGTTNSGNRYAGKVTGDSPEICRGLDAHGFADLKLSMAFHTSLSSKYAYNDPRRFNMGTPKEVWSTMCRCWEIKPTSARIVEDVKGFKPSFGEVLGETEKCIKNPDHMVRVFVGHQPSFLTKFFFAFAMAEAERSSDHLLLL
jgi:hypothetical protein